jgi:hypothetical protein
MVSRSSATGLYALPEKVLYSVEDEGSMIHGINLDSQELS